MKLFFPLYIVVFLFMSCHSYNGDKAVSSQDTVDVQMTEQIARRIFDMPIHCLTVEYPNKLGQSLGGDEDLKPPRALHPIFYGCFDWHSSVHGYWSVVKLLKAYPEFDSTGEALQLLKTNFTPENLAVEKAFFEDKNNLAFERTYGWAWLFKLQEELMTWESEEAQMWASTFDPLIQLLRNRLLAYLPNLVYPIRHGKHENTAFGLSLMLDYALVAKDTELQSAIVAHSKRLYEEDKGCNLSYEPSGSDFLSSCLEEAYLMSKVMDSKTYRNWLKDFMPEMLEQDFELEPAIVKDRSDGQLVHLDGLNYSRAACLYGIAKVQPGLQHLASIADKHIAFTLPNLSAEDDYMGSHWLGTFALYAFERRQ